jgi:hypothetical protein
MPRITVHAVNSPGEPRRWTLSERIVAENLDSDHYVNQLIERLTWATADAEAQEASSPGEAGAGDLKRGRLRRRETGPLELKPHSRDPSIPEPPARGRLEALSVPGENQRYD